MVRNVYFWIVAIVLVAAVVAGWAGTHVNKEKTDIVAEIFKACAQLVGVAGLGGLITYLYREAQERQAAQRKAAQDRAAANRQMDELRKDFLRKFRGIYFDVKKVRRLLSVAGLTGKFQRPPTVLTDAQLASYRENMLELNELQLKLEDLNSEVDICLSQHMEVGEMSKDLRKMEQYLRAVVKEFERFGRADLPDGQRIKFESLAELRVFTGNAKTNPDVPATRTFNTNLSMPYWNVVKKIYSDLAMNATQRTDHQPRFRV